MMQQGSTPQILIVDDDPEIRARLGKFLSDHGLDVSEAGNGQEMTAMLRRKQIDLVVLDVMMPGDDGLALCRRLRMDNTIPIILLTALSGDTDRIVGLELGADDYVTKPFNPRELLARIRALIRRSGMASTPRMPRTRPPVHQFSGWQLDINHRSLMSPDGHLVILTSSEFDLLAVFVEHPQRTMSREQLLECLHGRAIHQFDRSIDVHISRLRRKIEPNPANPTIIKTIRNEGYFFTPSVELAADPVNERSPA
ncbi:response regulator [Pelagibius sp. 7325]|uniref:response regulator n=1 Tax=Pelagibius sp. 7325 TaxID=3131994 RepID=UPI0030ED46B4